MAKGGRPSPRYEQVFSTLRREIQANRWRSGDRLPTEAQLGLRFGVSRITVARAMRELQHAGLVDRRPGSGTYVSARQPKGLSFGLLIPDLGETEIFEPICQGMMASPRAREHILLWGSLNGDRSATDSKESRAWHLCRQYIDRRAAGVFFAPLELTPGKDDLNLRVARALDEARIPLVLLDRPVLPYPRRGPHDLVGIDNRRAGYLMTDHLLRLGRRRVAFIARPRTAATVDAREAGYREALYVAEVPFDRAWTPRLDPADPRQVRAFMDATRPDGLVCANDRTAGELMRTLLDLRYTIPGDVSLVGIDDAGYAALLPVPLTTLRQPTRQIGDAALGAMLERVDRPDLVARDILLQCELIVRSSCGASTV